MTVNAPRLEARGLCLAKLDMPRERRLGFFDPWPWLSFGAGMIRRAPRLIDRAERVPLPAIPRLKPGSEVLLSRS